MVEVSAFPSLRLKDIQELLGSGGPCITILLPPFRPGEQSNSTPILLKSDIQEITRKLVDFKFPQSDISDLLQPLHEFRKSPDSREGSHWGRAIFCAPRVFRQFQLTEPVQKESKLAGSFQIRSLLTEAHFPAEFYVLKISKKRVNLLRCADLRSETVKLPNVPETLDEALALDRPDHDLENRSAAGSSAGAMRRVRFGSGSGREIEPSYVADFYKMVDRGIRELLNTRGAALVLVGVEEDIALYRSINSYPKLLQKSVHGSPDRFPQEAEMIREAYVAVRSDIVEREAAELAKRKEQVDGARLSTDLRNIVQAAFEGRAGWFYFDEAARTMKEFDGYGHRSWEKEDLHNLAAVQTILHGGEAFALPKEMMPNGASATAILRF